MPLTARTFAAAGCVLAAVAVVATSPSAANVGCDKPRGYRVKEETHTLR